MKLNVSDFEKALVTLIALWTGHTLGEDIFTSGLPADDVQDILAVDLGHDVDTDIDQGSPIREFEASILGRFSERADAVTRLVAIESNMPVFGIKDTFFDKSMYIKSIRLLDTGMPERSENNGNVSYLIHVIISYTVVTSEVIIE